MTISAVCKKYNITADTLRYYERIGLIPPVPRTASGIRDYDEQSCGWIRLMQCMRKAGIQISALIEYAALYQQGDDTLQERETLLKNQRALLQARIQQMNESLALLNYKIDRYEQGLMTSDPLKRQTESGEASSCMGQAEIQ